MLFIFVGWLDFFQAYCLKNRHNSAGSVCVKEMELNKENNKSC